METNKENRRFLYICVVSASLLAFVSSLNLTWPSPVMPILENDVSANPLPHPIDATDSSWIKSLLSLGASFGPLLAAPVSKQIGLKYTILIIALLFGTSFMILAFAETVELFYAARFIAGLGVGSTYSIVPPYIANASPDEIRGVMSSIFNIFVVTGLMLPYCIGPYMPLLDFNLVCAGIAVLFIINFIFMPESPVYLISKQKKSEAITILKRLRGTQNVDSEFNKMLETEEQNQSGSIADVFTIRSNLKALIISFSLVLFQQLSGINVVLANTQVIFEATGSSIPSEIASMIVGAVQILASFATPIFVDRAGRKILLLISAVGMLISEVPLGVYFYLKDDNQDVENIGWLPIVCLIAYIATYVFGFGGLPWTVMAELFPPNVTSIASALTAFVCWMASFLLNYFYNSMSENIGLYGTFWLFSACNVLAILFTFFFVPETKGKSTIEIQKMLR